MEDERHIVVVFHQNRETWNWVEQSRHEYDSMERARSSMDFLKKQIVDKPVINVIHHTDDSMLEWTNTEGTRVRVTTCGSCKRDGNRGPNHAPLSSCRSGKRPHCTCDGCF